MGRETMSWEGQNAAVARYYEHMTWQYTGFARGTHGWHYGVWDEDVRTGPQALLRSNERLVEGAELGPDSRVLDIGCGDGGFAIWVAKRFGCRVTGINIAKAHVEAARRRAARAGVAELCSFELLDMMNLAEAFPAERFDLVTNQETLCHANDKPRLFAGVHQILRAGGRWHAVAFSVVDTPLDAAGEAAHDAVCESWFFTPLAGAARVRELVGGAGLELEACEDITARVGPDARRILFVCRFYNALFRIGGDRLIYWNADRRSDIRRHYRAGTNYSEGLLDGVFKHYVYRARKPG